MAATDPGRTPAHPLARLPQASGPAPAAYRRRMGWALGALLGLTYGLVSQLINRLALPGIPLYQPPFGPLGNAILSTLVGAGLGFVVTFPVSAALGIALASLAAAVAIMINSLIRLAGQMPAGSQLVIGVLLSVPVAWFTVPVVALLRWAADRQADQHQRGEPWGVRWRVPLVLVLIMGFLAAFELLDDAARGQVRDMDGIVQAGLAAATPADLPAVLQDSRVRNFPAGVRQPYTLEWTWEDLDRFIELRPAANYDQHAAVIARFADGYRLVCLYPSPRSGPACGTY